VTRRRWIADEVHGDVAALTGEHASHLGRALRAQVGQQFDISTGDEVRRGTITSIAEDRVEFALGDALVVKASAEVTLVLSIFKFDRMEWAIEKCTEIGVARIVPVIARRTDSHLAAAAMKRHERWVRIARQAAEQSRRGGPPEIAKPVAFKELSSVAGFRVVLAEAEEERLLRDVLPEAAAVALAVGPEGGWTEDELRSFREMGWIAASLGETILRAETAAIVGTAIVMDGLL
jgi:16S rRNA (uracil1498-N3)-methyltransferase